MPVTETTHRLKSEADVIRISILQLLHPVNVALSALLPPGVTVYCERRRRKKKLAVVEFKNTKIIHWEDFEPAEVSQANAAEKMGEAMGNIDGTLLAGNAVSLSKQARKYSGSCKDIAVFDWNAMFIFDFYGIREDHLVPKPVKGIYFDESDAVSEGATFRLILFGFLVRALQRLHSEM
ncbi:hypothetical protein Egran_05757 [Elaphomyces granulatus]|uniref:Uncharacterized protein n=1 Tax=Elaphomyces granulatus TaxID=519963 RepID=A0A232LQN3_9EURO|nr:hypothetical protein Egran_05757 [Elaphomyces granulatus]